MRINIYMLIFISKHTYVYAYKYMHCVGIK